MASSRQQNMLITTCRSCKISRPSIFGQLRALRHIVGFIFGSQKQDDVFPSGCVHNEIVVSYFFRVAISPKAKIFLSVSSTVHSNQDCNTHLSLSARA